MKDIEQVFQSIKALTYQEAVDININIPVIGEALDDCLIYNREISSCHKNPITFSSLRFTFPHVTIKMGTVNPGKFDSVLVKLSQFKFYTIPLSPQPVILKAPGNKYYFSEINNCDLLELSAHLDDLLKDEMQPPKFPLSKDNLHHITLGYKYPDTSMVASVIDKIVHPFTADKIQVSIMGKFGVCLGVLKAFYL